MNLWRVGCSSSSSSSSVNRVSAFFNNNFESIRLGLSKIWFHSLRRCLVPKEKRPHQSLPLMLILLFAPVVQFLVSDWFPPAKIESQYSVKRMMNLQNFNQFFLFEIRSDEFSCVEVPKLANFDLARSRLNLYNWVVFSSGRVADIRIKRVKIQSVSTKGFICRQFLF